MQKPNYKFLRNSTWGLLFLSLFLLLANNAFSEEIPPVDETYKQFFVKFEDRRSFKEKALNIVGLTNQDVGRSFALIAGISYYPNMSPLDRELRPAAEDMKKLREYLETYEFFDEIVLLKNEDVTTENLEYFLQSYFPKRLKKFPKSRFLFAYSGHGMTEGSDGYLLKNTAQNLSDKDNCINLRILKVFVDEVVGAGHHVLVLLNACYGGVFLKRPFGDSGELIPKHPGAHAITAGGSGEIAWADPDIGTGSVFFEKLLAGLGGIADTEDDGVITAHELAYYLRREVQLSTDYQQNPQFGDISRHGSQGEFFFLNRQRQIDQGIVPKWRSEKATPMGINALKLLNKGREYYDSGDYRSAIRFYRQSAEAGEAAAMSHLGYMYGKGLGVAIDYDEALRWYHKGAQAGEPTAMLSLGVMYRKGLGVAIDYDEALRWYHKAAQAGSASGMNSLGYMYEEGLGVAIDYDEALRWYHKAAQAGSAYAMRNLGHMYFEGQGVAKDYDEALRWYHKAAQAGDAYAMTNLGYMYFEGQGVAKDYDEAVRWYRKAAEAGDEVAIDRLEELGEKP